MATQEFLDAVKGGGYADPAAWTTLADAWEASTFTADDAKLWVDEKIENPAVATMLIARTITPEDVHFIIEFFSPDALPNLEQAIVAIAVLKSMSEAGAPLSEHLRPAMLTAFFAEIADGGVTLVLGAAP